MKTLQHQALSQHSNGAVDSARAIVPRVDIFQEGDVFTIEAEIPGAKKEAIQVKLENEILTLEAPVTRRGEEYKYQRKFRVDQGIDGAAIQAEYREGILALTLPKAADRKARRIEVGA